MNIPEEKGISFIEILFIAGILIVLCCMAFMKISNQNQQKNEVHLQKSSKEFRLAIYNYFLDHGHYPCSENDYNKKGDLSILQNQLLWYTNEYGKPAKLRNRENRFGPYLPEFPIEPISNLHTVKLDSSESKTLLELRLKTADDSTATGGWLFQAKTGFLIANLNRKFFKDYYAYY